LAESYKNLGDEYFKKKKYQKAIASFNSSLEFAPMEINVLINRGKSYYFLKEKIKACTDWEKARELGNAEAQTLLEEYCKN
jgi:tetratricopeptide (TPR) repeat protein